MPITFTKSRLFAFAALLVLLAGLISRPVSAHQLPNTLIQLNVYEHTVGADIQIPLAELGFVLKEDLLTDTSSALSAHRQDITSYLSKHIHPVAPDGKTWAVAIDSPGVQATSPDASGSSYHQLDVQATLTPPKGANTRVFTFAYDALLHEDTTHAALVSIHEDWSNGIVGDDASQSVGIIQAQADGTISPLQINLSQGNLWKGFLGMVKLGMDHIREGTDHLLFLLTLLLPAPLLVVSRRWAKFGGIKRSLLNILKITTAFTIGHSFTLIASTLVRLNIPQQPIEALIAVSIIVSAIHALRPIFPNREMYIAAGFGLIHGMAFSFTLSQLNLDTPQLVLSLFGFNLGIELMQIIIIAITMPSLIMLATRPTIYTRIRIIGASFALIAAVGWLIERLGYPNDVSAAANSLSIYAVWVIVALAIMAAVVYVRRTLVKVPT